MSDIFPFVENDEDEAVEDEDLPLVKEWAWDFEKGDIALKNNKPYLVEGLEAVKIWVYKALMTDRFFYPFYSWDYGSELIDLIGSGYSPAALQMEAERLVEECLIENPYIEGINNLEATMDNDKLSVSFILVTIYGDVEVKI